MTERLDAYARDPVAFADDLVHSNEKGQPWRFSVYQRRVLALAFRWSPAGALLMRLLLWSEPKKSGKTFIAALLGLWWAFVNANTEIIVAANDLDQSVGRVFKTMVALCKVNPALGASVTLRATEILVSNGTVITAIASEYKGAAGSRHSLAIFDELWGFSLENAYRLYEELTPPPSEPNAWLLVVTTAGFTNESKLLEALYARGLGGERIDDELEVHRADDLVMFWSHTPRQPWQTAAYYAEQRRHLRPATFARLHENAWVSAESSFVTAEQWDACLAPEWSELEPSPDAPSLYVGVDLGLKHDAAAVVAVARDEEMVVLCAHRLWYPTGAAPLDLEATVEAYLRALYGRFRLQRVLCDPWQAARSIATLQAAGLPIEEYAQVSGNLTKMAETLYGLITSAALVVYDAPELRTMVLNATVAESERGVKLTKTTAGWRIDGAVALSMACVAAAVAEPALAPARLW